MENKISWNDLTFPPLNLWNAPRSREMVKLETEFYQSFFNDFAKKRKLMIGFKKLNQQEVELIDVIKQLSLDVEKVVDFLGNIDEVDQEKIKIACSHFEKGISGLIKACTSKNVFLMGA